MIINYVLPAPPSLNTAYYTDFKTKTRHKSAKAREWEKEAGKMLMGQKKYTLDGDEKLRVAMTLFTRWLSKEDKILKKDIANYEKLATDLLVKHIKGFEDSQIWEITLKKHHSDLNQLHVMICEN